MTLYIVSFEKILVYMLEILHNKLFFEYYWNFVFVHPVEYSLFIPRGKGFSVSNLVFVL